MVGYGFCRGDCQLSDASPRICLTCAQCEFVVLVLIAGVLLLVRHAAHVRLLHHCRFLLDGAFTMT
jgi:hypothetical protein